jgi:flagellar biosynthesis protein FlhF
MRLKTFQAKTMTEAMKQVRDTLGEEAVIISTSEENGGVRVTAAIEHMDDLPDPYPHDYEPLASRQSERPQFSNDLSAPKQIKEKEYLQYDAEEDFEGEITEELTDIMLRHVVPTEVMDNILSTAAMTGLGNTNSALMAALDHLYKFVPLPAKSKRKALMLVGPPGAGKTLMVAKMATRAVMDGLHDAVRTTETRPPGGVEHEQA